MGKRIIPVRVTKKTTRRARSEEAALEAEAVEHLSDEDLEGYAERLIRDRAKTSTYATRLLGKQHHFEEDVRLQLRKDIETAAFQDRLIDTIKAEAVRLKPLAAQLPKLTREDEEYILQFSDPQYGSFLTLLRTMGLGEVSPKIIQERMMLLAAEVIERQKRNPVAVLNIFGLGDYIENTGIYPGQHFEVSRNSVQQTIEFGLLFAEFLRALAPHFQFTMVK